MKFCNNCGEPILPGSKFCQNCGARLPEPQPVYEQPPVYTPPVQEPAPQPVYEQPPIFTPPVQEPAPRPVYEQPPVYTPPVQEPAPRPVYEQPPVYTPGQPPVQTPVTQQPAPKSGKARTILFAGIAAVVVIGLILAFVLGSGGGGSGSSKTFELGKETEATTTAPETTAPIAAEVGYWTLLRVENDDPDLAMTEAEVEALRKGTDEIFLDLKNDGTGVGNFYTDTAITWGDGKLTMSSQYMDFDYSLVGDELHLYADFDDSTYVYVRGTGKAPSVDLSVSERPTGDSDYKGWWEGSWYGWWIVYEGTGEYEDLVDSYWDTYAIVEFDNDTTGTITLWDEDTSRKDPMGEVNISFTDGDGENGCFYTTDGWIWNSEIGYYDWLVDPANSTVSHFDHMIEIEGYYTDPNDPDSMIHYLVFLRPWGMKWDDVENGDVSDCYYDNMMPAYYDSWYLPLLKKGITTIPNSYDEGKALIN